MHHFTEKVLIARTGKFRESDLWVRFLSPSRGMLTGFAFGGCRSRRRFCGCLDSLNLVLFRVSPGSRGRYLVLEEGTLIHGYQRLKNNPSRVGMAVNGLRFVQKVCLEGDNSENVYKLMLAYLETVEDTENVPAFFPVLFRAAVLFSHGFEPNFSQCALCGKKLENIAHPSFLFAQGTIACPGCDHRGEKRIKVRRDSLIFLSRLNSSSPESWLKWSVHPDILQDSIQVVEAFTDYHLGNQYNTA